MNTTFEANLVAAFEDLSSRFILNLPNEELNSIERLLFQLEQAHWYYEDFIRPSTHNSLPSYSLKQFSLQMIKSIPILNHLVPNYDQIWSDFKSYKDRVPVCGAILISDNWDKVLLVRGFDAKASWSFPRGKINKEEPEADCAIREVLEETGYNIFPHFPVNYNPNSDDPRDPYFVELVIKEQRIRLYFIPNVSESTRFETRTRKEIGKIEWFSINDLPVWKNNKTVPPPKSKPSKHYMLTPFVSQLKLWIQQHKPKNFKSKPNKAIPNHLQESYQPPLFESDIDVGRSTSPSSASSEDVDGIQGDDEEDLVRKFSTLEEGNSALQAFFFGALGPPLLPIPVLQNEYEDDRFASPPENLPDYKNAIPVSPRRPSFDPDLLQPVPKTTSRQTSLLLALLTNQDPVASPPPSRKSVANAAIPSLLSIITPPLLVTPPTNLSLAELERKTNRSTLLNVLNDLTFPTSPNRQTLPNFSSPILNSRATSSQFDSPHLSPRQPSSHHSPAGLQSVPLPVEEKRSTLMSILNSQRDPLPLEQQNITLELQRRELEQQQRILEQNQRGIQFQYAQAAQINPRSGHNSNAYNSPQPKRDGEIRRGYEFPQQPPPNNFDHYSHPSVAHYPLPPPPPSLPHQQYPILQSMLYQPPPFLPPTTNSQSFNPNQFNPSQFNETMLPPIIPRVIPAPRMIPINTRLNPEVVGNGNGNGNGGNFDMINDFPPLGGNGKKNGNNGNKASLLSIFNN